MDSITFSLVLVGTIVFLFLWKGYSSRLVGAVMVVASLTILVLGFTPFGRLIMALVLAAVTLPISLWVWWRAGRYGLPANGR